MGNAPEPEGLRRHMRNFGGKNWTRLWQVLEQQGNVGIDYFINPYLYREIAAHANKGRSITVADFGAGTGILALQFMYGYQAAVPGLSDIADLQSARGNIHHFHSFEGSRALVKKGLEYLRDIGSPEEVSIAQHEIQEGSRVPIDDGTLSLAVSRNLFMHLSVHDLAYHFNEAHRILTKGGVYICALLNPEYEQGKYARANPKKKPLANNQRYAFAHGASGEHGTFYHYWKDTAAYEAAFKENFTIVTKIPSLPLTERFATSHARYYDPHVPMAFIYVLKKRV